MTPDAVYQSLTDEQLDAFLNDSEMRGPGRKRLQQEKDRRSPS